MKVGKLVRFDPAEIAAWLDDRRTPPRVSKEEDAGPLYGEARIQRSPTRCPAGLPSAPDQRRN